MRRNLTIIAGCAWVLAGCSEEHGPTSSTATSTIGTSKDGRRLYVASAEEDAVLLVDQKTRTSQRVYEGGGPRRVAIEGEHVLFTLRDEDRIGFGIDSKDGLSELTTIEAGGAPFGVVIDPTGERAYVSLPEAGVVHQIDVAQRAIAQSFDVEGEPSWLALNPSAEKLYAAGGDNVLSAIDLRSAEVTRHEVPTWIIERYGLVEGVPVIIEYELVPRLTGDPAVTPDGAALLLPAIYEPRPVVETATATDLVRAYSALIVVPLGTDGAPLEARVRATSTQPQFLAGLASLPESLPLGPGRPVSVTASPDSGYALVTHAPDQSDALHLVVAVPLLGAAASVSALTSNNPAPGQYGASGTLAIPGSRPGLSTNLSSFSIPDPPPFGIQADHGLRGITFTDADSAWIHSALDRNVTRLDAGLIESVIYDADPSVRYRALRSIALEPPIGF